VFFELDQLEKRLNRSPRERLARLEQHLDLVERRDDLMIEYITLLNLLGRHDQAYTALLRRRFHPWEGGEGKSTGQYLISLVGQARSLIAVGEHAQAIERLERALIYPPNLARASCRTRRKIICIIIWARLGPARAMRNGRAHASRGRRPA